MLRRDRSDPAVVHKLGKADDAVERCPQLVRHIGEKLAFQPVGFLDVAVLRFQFIVRGPQLLFQDLSIRDVANRAEHQNPVFSFEGAEADLDGKFAAVFAQTVERQSGADGSHFGTFEKGLPVLRMFTAKALRHQHLHRFSQQLGPAVFEELFRLGIDENDFSFFVDDDAGVGRRLQQSTELGFGFFPLGDVADRAHRKGAFFGFERAARTKACHSVTSLPLHVV